MQLGWIDFSKEDKSNALNVINSLKDKGVLDELGFGVLRQAFANYFFPGTSTIQTRAKYFLIIPYELQDFIRIGHSPKSDAAGFIKRAQELIDWSERTVGHTLIKHCSTDPQASGIIGARSIAGKSWVERPPISIYWNGLRTYRFFRNDNPNFTYYDFLTAIYNMERNKAAARSSENEDKDDKNDSDAGNYSKKSPLIKLDIYKKGWDKEVDIELTKDEALFLKSKIISSVPDSMMALLLKQDIDLEKCIASGSRNSFELFSKTIKEYVDTETAKKLELANRLNEFYFITMLRYSFQLCKGEVTDIVDEWNEMVPEVKRICNNFDVEDLFKTMNIKNPKLKIFLIKLKEAFLKNDIEQADTLIRKREFSLKTNRAKLSKPDYKDLEAGIFSKFDYRLSNAWTIIRDVRNGEGR